MTTWREPPSSSFNVRFRWRLREVVKEMGVDTANVWDVFCHTPNSKGKFKSIVDEMDVIRYVIFQDYVLLYLEG